MLISAYEVRHTCRQFGLSPEANQCERVARAYALFMRKAVHLPRQQVCGYLTYCVDSQYTPGLVYTVRVFVRPTGTTVTCSCPAFHRGYAETGITGIHAGPLCKHGVAVLLERAWQHERHQHAQRTQTAD